MQKTAARVRKRRCWPTKVKTLGESVGLPDDVHYVLIAAKFFIGGYKGHSFGQSSSQNQSIEPKRRTVNRDGLQKMAPDRKPINDRS